MRKGNLVKLNPATCFTTKSGGGLRYPLTNYACDDARVVYAGRPVTREETAAWYESDASKGMTSGGDTKLPPQSMRIKISADDVLVVERARCRVRLGWGNPTPGMAKVLNPVTGESAYIKRELLEVIS